jgi:hypothetical protein
MLLYVRDRWCGTLRRYNVGQVAIGIGDLNLAYQALKIAISIDPEHAESFNNIGVRNRCVV